MQRCTKTDKLLEFYFIKDKSQKLYYFGVLAQENNKILIEIINQFKQGLYFSINMSNLVFNDLLKTAENAKTPGVLTLGKRELLKDILKDAEEGMIYKLKFWKFFETKNFSESELKNYITLISRELLS